MNISSKQLTSEVEDEAGPNCTPKCRSILHGRLIRGIGTKGSDTEVINLWIKTCNNYSNVKDEFGSTSIHIAAAMGRLKVVLWLIQTKGVNINTKELLNGYSPLHLSLFFGQIHVARALIQHGANIGVTDNEGLTPFELIVKDRNVNFSRCPNESIGDEDKRIFELWVWGSNDNYTCGIGKENGTNIPQILDTIPFQTKKGLVVLQTYHSIFVPGTEDDVLVVGTGPRLGIDSMLAINPIPLCFSSRKDTPKFIQIAAGPDHTLFLMQNGSVWSCGSNTNFVLGGHDLSPPNSAVFKPKRIGALRNHKICHVAASQYHSVFTTEDEVFVCGVNTGQLGFSCMTPGEIISTPEHVPALWPDSLSLKIQHVTCNEYATVITNESMIIHLLYKNDRHRIDLRHIPLNKIVKTEVIGGHWSAFYDVSGKQPGSDTKGTMAVFILSRGPPRKLIIWRMRETKGKDSNCFLTTVIFDIGRPVSLVDVAVNKSTITIVSEEGEGFQGTWDMSYVSPATPDSGQSAMAVPEFIENFHIWSISKRRRHTLANSSNTPTLEFIKMRRIRNIYRGYKVFCNPKNSSFAVMQRCEMRSSKYLSSDWENYLLASNFCSIKHSLRKLLENASLNDDLHDVEFRVGGKVFPAHRYVIHSRSQSLYSLIDKSFKDSNCVPVVVEISDISSNTFNELLKLTYTGINEESLSISNSNEFPGLSKLLKKFGPFELLRKESGLEFADAILVCNQGVEIPVHRCILTTRLEYFERMLGSSFWRESTLPKINLPFEKSTISWLLRHLYEGDSTPSCYSNMLKDMATVDMDSLLTIVQLADMVQCDALQIIAQFPLSFKLTQKNVTEILPLATMFNASYVENVCLELIDTTLVYQLENGLLNSLDDDNIRLVSQHYRKTHLALRKGERWLPRSSETPTEDTYRTAISPITEEELNLFIEPHSSSQFDSDLTFVKKFRKTKSGTKLRNFSKSEHPETETSTVIETNSPIFPSSQMELSVGLKSNKWMKVSSSIKQHRIRKYSEGNESLVKTNHSSPTAIVTCLPNFEIAVKSQSQSPKKTLPIPIPLKGNRIELENRKLAEQDVKFESLSDFPCLYTDELTMSQSRLVIDTISAPVNQSRSLNSEKISKISKRRTKWKSLSISSETGGEVTMGTETPHANTPPERNPWKILKLPIITMPERVDFETIVVEEQRRLENSKKALQKSLRLLQMEDEAVEEFRSFFSTQEVLDGVEVVEVCRYKDSIQFVDPVWPGKV